MICLFWVDLGFVVVLGFDACLVFAVFSFGFCGLWFVVLVILVGLWFVVLVVLFVGDLRICCVAVFGWVVVWLLLLFVGLLGLGWFGCGGVLLTSVGWWCVSSDFLLMVLIWYFYL